MAVLNAGLGMKHPTESSIMYCKTDNCYTANRQRNPWDVYADERYKYSPCPSNHGRLLRPQHGKAGPRITCRTCFWRKTTALPPPLSGRAGLLANPAASW